MDNQIPRRNINKSTLLLLSVFVISTCGLIYELIAGTLASYLLGDSVTQFSTIIGTYLFAMGIGSYLSRHFQTHLVLWFIRIELLIGLIGGFSSTALFILFEQVFYFRVILYTLIGTTGVLVGLEIPILMRMLKNQFEFKDLVSEVFTFDYIGALLASLVFPLLFVPHIGLIRTSLFFGIINTAVALWVLYSFKQQIAWIKSMLVLAWGILTLLVLAFAFADTLQEYSESLAYQDKIIISESSPYQRIVVTNNKKELRLFLNGNLQFSTLDEYRYHEALVHPLMASTTKHDTIVIMGGGDGLAVRELLRYPEIKKIYLVDLDQYMTELFKEHPALTPLNDSSLSDARVEICNEDAFVWTLRQQQKFHLIIIDFPDPSNYSLGKLYSTSFYKHLQEILDPDGRIVVQSTSPFYAPNSYWCVNNTLIYSGFQTLPYHTYIPSFGEWGYIIAYKSHFQAKLPYPEGLKFMTPESFAYMTQFPKDMGSRETDINKLNNQSLVHYFDEEWSKFIQ